MHFAVSEPDFTKFYFDIILFRPHLLSGLLA
jgi:hypothetical protein